MRTIDATLQSTLATGHFIPYFKLKVYANGSLSQTLDVIQYKLTGTHLSVTVRGMLQVSNSPEWIKVILSRGAVVNGTPIVVDTSLFTPNTGTIEKVSTKGLYVQSTVECELIPPRILPNINASGTYKSVIDSFCTAIGKTAVYKNGAAAYWTSEFFGQGTGLQLNNAQLMLPLLIQKHLIFACDAGSENILFYCALDLPGAADAVINPILVNIGTGYYGQRRFMAVDQYGAVRFAGSANDPIWNLGFVQDIDPMPGYYVQNTPLDFETLINLNYQDGDRFTVDAGNYTLYPAQVIEIFDRKASPGWKVSVKQLIYFTNTEGGSLPSSIQQVSAYMPLNTSLFTQVLNAQANNVQSAMDMIDDHQHSGGTAIALSGWISGAGTWSYSSVDGPTGVISINADVTSLIMPGDRIKLTQTTVKYGILTAVGVYSGGNTLVTVYFGTDYTLANAAISNPFYSPVKAPFGFPMNPDKWTVLVTDSGNRSQNSPVSGTWYNPNAISISIPIGLWYVEYLIVLTVTSNAAKTECDCYSTLSTANNSESDAAFSTIVDTVGASATLAVFLPVYKRKLLSLVSKTSYYLNIRTDLTGMTLIAIRGDLGTSIVRAICAYL